MAKERIKEGGQGLRLSDMDYLRERAKKSQEAYDLLFERYGDAIYQIPLSDKEGLTAEPLSLKELEQKAQNYLQNQGLETPPAPTDYVKDSFPNRNDLDKVEINHRLDRVSNTVIAAINQTPKPTYELIHKCAQGDLEKNNQDKPPAPILIQLMEKDGWFKNPVEGAMTTFMPALSQQRRHNLLADIEYLDSCFKDAKDRGKLWGLWLKENGKKILGKKFGKKFEEEVDNITKFFTKGDSKEKSLRVLALSLPIATLGPAALALPATLVFLFTLAATALTSALNWKKEYIDQGKPLPNGQRLVPEAKENKEENPLALT